MPGWNRNRSRDHLEPPIFGSRWTACFAKGMPNCTFSTLNNTWFSYTPAIGLYKHRHANMPIAFLFADAFQAAMDNMQFLVWAVHRTFARQWTFTKIGHETFSNWMLIKTDVFFIEMEEGSRTVPSFKTKCHHPTSNFFCLNIFFSSHKNSIFENIPKFWNEDTSYQK